MWPFGLDHKRKDKRTPLTFPGQKADQVKKLWGHVAIQKRRNLSYYLANQMNVGCLNRVFNPVKLIYD